MCSTDLLTVFKCIALYLFKFPRHSNINGEMCWVIQSWRCWKSSFKVYLGLTGRVTSFPRLLLYVCFYRLTGNIFLCILDTQQHKDKHRLKQNMLFVYQGMWFIFTICSNCCIRKSCGGIVVIVLVVAYKIYLISLKIIYTIPTYHL